MYNDIYVVGNLQCNWLISTPYKQQNLLTIESQVI
jgi:predicted Rdx family selenoprotein